MSLLPIDQQTVIRFLMKVEINNTCWNWCATCGHNGYGQFWFKHANRLAHRISYLIFKGEIPDGLTIDHLCKNVKCVNPAHLEAVTIGENLLRGETFQGKNARKTHCPHGHEYTPENTRVHEGKRYCRKCCCINQRNYRARKHLEIS